jgi:hypothetical protein
LKKVSTLAGGRLAEAGIPIRGQQWKVWDISGGIDTPQFAFPVRYPFDTECG